MFPLMRFARVRTVQPRDRHGLTVVEVLVALVIVSVGLLGMAGTSALLLRTATSAAREQRAVRRLDFRLAALAAAGCGRAAGGAAQDPGDGVRERWTVGTAEGGAALLDATAEWRDGRGLRAMSLRSAILC
jgi:prepilin-type N-terminal cleavage/methylation domain-containing protein